MKKMVPHQRVVKHDHATPNPIIQREEETILSIVDKALDSSSNSQTIGRNGEIPLRNFFNRYLPYTLRAVTGHFVPPSGVLSPQIDIMILDSRYPLLAENVDGSVLAMLHSVVQTIEIKTNITTRDISKIWNDTIIIQKLANETDGYGAFAWGGIQTIAFAYRSVNRLDSLEKKYIDTCETDTCGLDIYLMRIHEKYASKRAGCVFHFEPDFESDDSDKVIGYIPITRASYTPLSDLFFEIVQSGYYTLGSRNYTYSDIGRHLLNYMSWSSAFWEDILNKE